MLVIAVPPTVCLSWTTTHLIDDVQHFGLRLEPSLAMMSRGIDPVKGFGAIDFRQTVQPTSRRDSLSRKDTTRMRDLTCS